MSFTVLIKALKGIRFRLTLVYTLSFGLFICIFAFILTKQFFTSTEKNFDSALLNHAIDLSRNIGSTSIMDRMSKYDDKKLFPFLLKDTYYMVRSLDGTILKRDTESSIKNEIPYDKDLLQQSESNHYFYSHVHEGTTFRTVNFRITNDQGQEQVLQVATPYQQLSEQENRIIILNFTIIPLLMLVAGAVSYILAGRALAPIKVVTETVNNIAATNLSLRLPEFQTADEFQDLSVTFNSLLERLQKSFEAQEHFVANASHQLNTPLAIIKGELNVLDSKPRTIEEHQKFNRSLREEVDRMIELVKNLLLIARIEAGQEDSFRMRPMRLDDLLISTISRMKLKAKDKRITIRFNISDEVEIEDLVIEGERQLLDSMFENLLDNAIKYSPESSVVSVDIGKKENIIVSIKDEGPGIKPHDLKNILEKRFRRGSMTLLPGTGIGLSISSKIAQHHKATISYEKLQPQGSLFMVHFAKQNL